MTPRFVLLQYVAIVFLLIAWYEDVLLSFLLGDKTYMTWGIVAVAILGLVFIAKRKITLLRWTIATLPTLGLLGTVLGFSSGIEGMTEDSFDTTLAGLTTALNTTIAGLIGMLWLSMCGGLLLHESQ